MRQRLPVCSSGPIRRLCVESVLQAKLVARAHHMWKHSPNKKLLAGTDGRRGGGERNRDGVCAGEGKEAEGDFFFFFCC